MKVGFKSFLVFCVPIAFVIALSIHSNAAEANVENGATLYKKCAGCHTANPKFAGKEVKYLQDKMAYYRDGKFENPKVLNMQKSFGGMSDQDLMDLATYLNKM